MIITLPPHNSEKTTTNQSCLSVCGTGETGLLLKNERRSRIIGPEKERKFEFQVLPGALRYLLPKGF